MVLENMQEKAKSAVTKEGLSDLTVVELADFVSGPFCTKMFADLGAEIIKVEKPGNGDITRSLGPFPNDLPSYEHSGLFIYLNTNKLGVTLDIRHATGRKILRELISQADIFVESNPRQLMEELELDYESLKRLNPRLLMTSITPWGHTGPYRNYKGYDISISAAGGVACRLGLPEREPLQMPGYLSSYYSGITAAAATMLALYLRDIGYPGQHVDISQVRCWATTYASLRMTAFLTEQAVSSRHGSQLVGLFPYTVMPVKNGMIIMICIEDANWQLACRLMGDPEWAKDTRFETTSSRYEHREELLSLMKPWLMSNTKSEILKAALENGAFRICVPVQTIDELVNSKHLQERGFFVEVEQPQVGKVKCPGAPYKFSQMAWQIRRPAPCLGEHNEEIYCGRLGYAREELVRLRVSDII